MFHFAGGSGDGGDSGAGGGSGGSGAGGGDREDGHGGGEGTDSHKFSACIMYVICVNLEYFADKNENNYHYDVLLPSVELFMHWPPKKPFHRVEEIQALEDQVLV